MLSSVQGLKTSIVKFGDYDKPFDQLMIEALIFYIMAKLV